MSSRTQYLCRRCEVFVLHHCATESSSSHDRGTRPPLFVIRLKQSYGEIRLRAHEWCPSLPTFVRTSDTLYRERTGDAQITVPVNSGRSAGTARGSRSRTEYDSRVHGRKRGKLYSDNVLSGTAPIHHRYDVIAPTIPVAAPGSVSLLSEQRVVRSRARHARALSG